MPLLPDNADVQKKLAAKNRHVAGITHYLKKYSGYPVYNNTDIIYYDDAAKGLEAQKEDLKKATEFLEDKNNVQLVMQLKGRDMPRVDFGLELMKTICERLKPYSKQIEEPKMTGRKIIAVCRS